mgnify:CR=1 FL=1
MPDLEISTLSFSSTPIGTSICGIFGILDKISSRSSLTDLCCSLIFSIDNEISFDFANKDLSLDFEIFFFFFS